MKIPSKILSKFFFVLKFMNAEEMQIKRILIEKLFLSNSFEELFAKLKLKQ